MMLGMSSAREFPCELGAWLFDGPKLAAGSVHWSNSRRWYATLTTTARSVPFDKEPQNDA
jgi:hypothetical protein